MSGRAREAGGVAADRPTVATGHFGTVYLAWRAETDRGAGG